MANEKWLIDANALRGEMYEYVFPITANNLMGAADAYYRILHLLEAAPTVDAVEVAEYDAIVNKLECLLCHATGGKYSKAGYSWEDMERMVTDYIEERCEEAVEEAVLHGRWVKVNDGVLISSGHHWECSACGKWVPWECTGWRYCPNCGAKMDGGEET